MKDKRWILFARVSSEGQIDNTSTDKQIGDLEEALQRSDGEAVAEMERAESGAQMDRESLSTILDMANEKALSKSYFPYIFLPEYRVGRCAN